jgi:hypothetical protein
MNTNSSNINSRLEKIVKTPIKNLGSNNSNKFGKMVNTPIKNMGSNISNRLGNNINEPIKSFGSNINNTFDQFVNTPIKNMGSKISESGLSYNNNTYETSGSYYALFKKILFWFAIILLLAFFGFNIFQYLAQGTDIIATLVSPFTYTIAYFSGETAKTTLKHTSQGTQAIVSESSTFLQIFLQFITDLFTNSVTFVTDGTTSAIDYLQSNIKKDKTIDVKPEKQIKDNSVNIKETPKIEKTEETQETDEIEEEDTSMLKEERKIENRVQNVSDDIKKLIIKKEETEPEPVQSDMQQNGYCYIGKINDARYCAKVTSKNNCLSGDIFPTMAVCVNPNLRT